MTTQFVCIIIWFACVLGGEVFGLGYYIEITEDRKKTRIELSSDLLVSSTPDSLYLGEVCTYEFTIVNRTKQRLDVLLCTDNPTVSYISLQYVDSNGKVVDLAKGGNSVPVTSRMYTGIFFNHRVSIWPNLPQTYRVTVSNSCFSCTNPIYVSSPKEFTQKASRYLLVLGVIFGLIFIVFIYTGFSFFSLNQPYFFWFSLFIFFIGWIMSLQFGIFSFFFSVSNPTILYNLYAWAYTFTFTAFVGFVVRFFDAQKELSVLVNALIGLIVGRILINTGYSLFPHILLPQILLYSRFIFVVILAFTYYMALHAKNRSKVLIIIFGIALLLLFTLVILGLMFDFGWTPISSDTLAIWLFVVLFQMLMFLWAISIRVNQIADEYTRLREKMRETKLQLFQAYVEGASNEKEHISSELRVMVLDELAPLKKAFYTLPKEYLYTLMDIEKDICQISKSLHNPKKMDFIEEVKSLIEYHKNSQTLFSLRSESVTKKLPIHIQQHLIRIIQEAIQNIEKHAYASRVEIQIFQSIDRLALTIEDNGEGFDQAAHSDGIGLQNIAYRVEEMKGSFEISSSLGQGVSILITVPLAND